MMQASVQFCLATNKTVHGSVVVISAVCFVMCDKAMNVGVFNQYQQNRLTLTEKRRLCRMENATDSQTAHTLLHLSITATLANQGHLYDHVCRRGG